MTVDDAELEIAFVDSLSEESRYQRFFQHLTTLPPSMLDRLVRLDYVKTMAVMATVCSDAKETLVGVSRYAAVADTHCEFALAIADDWQRRGLGRRLLQILITLAHGNGFTRLGGEVLSSNEPMLRLLKGMNFESKPEGSGLISVWLDL